MFDEKEQNGMAAAGKDNSFWGPMLEKAFAKMYGSYGHLEGGVMSSGVRAMIGGINTIFPSKSKTEDQIWAELMKQEKTSNIMTSGTNGFGDHNANRASGLSMSHAYTVLKPV